MKASRVWIDSTPATYQREKFFYTKINLWFSPQSLILRASAASTRNKILHCANMSTPDYWFFLDRGQAILVPLFYRHAAMESYQHIQIWWYVCWIFHRFIVISLYSDVSWQRILATKTDIDTIATNSDCTLISANAIMLLGSIKRILSQRSAKIIANRLHYTRFTNEIDNFT